MPPENKDRNSSRGREPADRIQRFFRRPFFLSATIGIPFCIFKLLLGIVAVRELSAPMLAVIGWGIILWAGTDLLMNLGRALLDILHRESPFEYCTIAQLGQLFGMPAVFLALDTLLAFLIICGMLWSGWITRLTGPESWLWYAATTLNLVSLSLVLLFEEVHRVRT
ncbi:MAG: hypothetical protein GKC05_04595 [Methanomicrobiales archaeon]|nr:hypothetical protein [Methanomicrobiales archaeon]NYT21748.1 hypothetical protein [Methanomicrobiales archaeon]